MFRDLKTTVLHVKLTYKLKDTVRPKLVLTDKNMHAVFVEVVKEVRLFRFVDGCEHIFRV